MELKSCWQATAGTNCSVATNATPNKQFSNGFIVYQKPLRAPAGRGPSQTFFHPEDSPFPLRKLKSYVDQARIQLPHRLVSWNFAFREGVGALLTEDFAHSVNGASPREHMQMVYDSFDSGRLLDRFLVYDWRITLADNDLRKVGQMCALAGVEVDLSRCSTTP